MRDKIFLERFKKEYPGVKVLTRDQSYLMRAIFYVLKLFGADTKYSSYNTTIGQTIYVRDDWGSTSSDYRYKLLRHEAMHVRSFHQWPFKFLDKKYLWYINAFIMGFCYLLVFPVKWTMRSKFEKEGYLQNLFVEFQLGQLTTFNQREIAARELAVKFSDSTYFYMASYYKIYKWAHECMDKMALGTLKNDKDLVP